VPGAERLLGRLWRLAARATRRDGREPVARGAAQGRPRAAAGPENPSRAAAGPENPSRAAAGPENLLGAAARAQDPLRAAARAQHLLRAAARAQHLTRAAAGTEGLVRAAAGSQGDVRAGLVSRRPGRLAARVRRAGAPRALVIHSDERSVRLSAGGVALASPAESEYAAWASCATGMHAAFRSHALQARRGASAERPSGRHRQAQAAEDHETYAKAQDCAHFQPEGQ